MISIHATLAGGDEFSSFWVDKRKGFLSTPPSRVATLPAAAHTGNPPISIHATLAGGDDCALRCVVQRAISIHATLAGGDG